MSGAEQITKPGGHEVFPDQLVEDAWRERWCHTCFRPGAVLERTDNRGPRCRILAQALQGVLPPQWERSTRKDPAAHELYRCERYLDEPQVPEPVEKEPVPQEELFAEPEHQDKRLIPVPDWPGYSAFRRRR